MNRGHGRLLLCACLTLLIGCGARTSTLEDELGGQNAGGAAGDPGYSGSGGVHLTPGGGAPSGGAPTAGFGFGGSLPIPAGGAPAAGAPFGGAPAGGFGTGGAAGAPHGGAPFAGAPAGGAPFAGAPAGGFAGFGAIGGDAGTGGIGELCSVLGGSTCAECQCKTCAPAIEGCFSDLGCTFIFACAQQTGCNGISCYSPTTCQPVIDQFGGLGGASMKRVFSLLTCAVTAQTSCGCN
ncbi:MAG: hypothetical protein ABUL62_09735 [Myxococcales bacterium]